MKWVVSFAMILVLLLAILLSVWFILHDTYRITQSERRDRIRNMLHRICSILNENQIEYHITAGSLLGIVRENDVLAWDDDGDIVIMKNHLGAALRRLKEEKSWILKKHASDFYVIEDAMHVHVDLYVYENDSATQMCRPASRWRRWKHDKFAWFVKGDNVPSFKMATVYPIRWMQWQDKWVCVPNDVNEYLDVFYGKDWRIPKKSQPWYKNLYDRI